MTKHSESRIMAEEGRCYIKAVGPPFEPPRESNRGEVVRMWKRRLFAVLRFVVLCIVWALALSTKAC